MINHPALKIAVKLKQNNIEEEMLICVQPIAMSKKSILFK